MFFCRPHNIASFGGTTQVWRRTLTHDEHVQDGVNPFPNNFKDELGFYLSWNF
jgi:hypothetical protein